MAELTFEAALLRLEEIVDELDRGELPLEEAIARFAEGSRLKEFCTEKLAEAQAVVEELVDADTTRDDTADDDA